MSTLTEETGVDCCPFCGSDMVTVESARAPDEGYQAECALCSACGPLSESILITIQAWNERS